MAKKSEEPVTKHTLNLFEDDFRRLQNVYPEVGAAVIIRKLVRKHLNEVDPKPNTTKIKVTL